MPAHHVCPPNPDREAGRRAQERDRSARRAARQHEPYQPRQRQQNYNSGRTWQDKSQSNRKVAVAQKGATHTAKPAKAKGHRSKRRSGHDGVSSEDDSTGSSSCFTLVQGSGIQQRIPLPSANMIEAARNAQLRKAQLLEELPNERINLQVSYQENDDKHAVPCPPVVGEELAKRKKSFRDRAVQAKPSDT